jgi:hypothetical protein
MNYLPGLASKHDPPKACVLSSYSHKPLLPANNDFFKLKYIMMYELNLQHTSICHVCCDMT